MMLQFIDMFACMNNQWYIADARSDTFVIHRLDRSGMIKTIALILQMSAAYSNAA